ncbi:hypothetical protein ABWH92_09670 [Ahrensia marina]|uniref:hypothetical protein n=1 Tax=Ahrensia marina TaxID=1514904 RepID=UPI0035CF2793
MSDEATNVVPIVSRASRLADALRRARAREQSRLREAMAAQEGRLDALADELRAMADELPSGEADRFALMPSDNGERLVVDALSYVDLQPETMDYRLVLQRRDGPDVIVEKTDREAMADSVADYIADRIVEREGLVDRTPDTSTPTLDTSTPTLSVESDAAPQPRSRFWPGFWLFVLGGVCSATALFTYAWLQAGPTG